MSNYVKVCTFSFDRRYNKITSDFYKEVSKMREYLSNKFEQVMMDRPDLILLPELCDIPPEYTAKEIKEYCKARGTDIDSFFRETALQNKCYIVYNSYREDKKGRWYNSTIVIDRQGNTRGIYNKNYPTPQEIAEFNVEIGCNPEVIKCDFGCITPIICFE